MVKVDMSKEEEKVVYVGFTRRVVACIEGQDHTARLVVRRQGPAELMQQELSVRVKTQEEGTETEGESAKAGKNFKPVDTVLQFAPGVTEVTQEIDIVDNTEVSEDVFLTVALSDAKLGGTDGAAKAELGGELQFATCRVQIQDDDKNPGCFRWHTERVEVYENVGKVNLTVLRTNGLNGEVSIEYKTKDQQATAGKDYVAAEGTLVFPHGVVSRSLTIEIIDDDTFEKDETFTVVLSEPTGGATFDKATDGGSDSAVCTVVILNDDEITSKLEAVVSLLRINADNLALARDNWAEALRDAIVPHAEANAVAKFMHFLNVPWKLMFAIVPPPGLLGGWPCFFGALVMIGIQVLLQRTPSPSPRNPPSSLALSLATSPSRPLAPTPLTPPTDRPPPPLGCAHLRLCGHDGLPNEPQARRHRHHLRGARHVAPGYLRVDGGRARRQDGRQLGRQRHRLQLCQRLPRPRPLLADRRHLLGGARGHARVGREIPRDRRAAEK